MFPAMQWAAATQAPSLALRPSRSNAQGLTTKSTRGVRPRNTRHPLRSCRSCFKRCHDSLVLFFLQHRFDLFEYLFGCCGRLLHKMIRTKGKRFHFVDVVLLAREYDNGG